MEKGTEKEKKDQAIGFTLYRAGAHFEAVPESWIFSM